jgi:very-short-patch-repair endonuclease
MRSTVVGSMTVARTNRSRPTHPPHAFHRRRIDDGRTHELAAERGLANRVAHGEAGDRRGRRVALPPSETIDSGPLRPLQEEHVHSAAINRTLADLAAEHHGLVCLGLTRPLGIDRDHLHRRTASGLLVPVDDGIYRASGAPVTYLQRVLAACWCHGDEALISHRNGALLWRLDGVARAPLEVLVPRWKRHAKRPGIKVHETKTLRAIDRATVENIPCTSVVRTLLDLTAVVPERRADQAFEDALRRRLCTLDDLANRFSQLARRGRPGVVVARRLIEKRGIGYVPTQSDFERLVSELAERAGLGRPQRQIRVALTDRPAWIDLGWADLLLGVECDGLIGHANNVTLPWDDDRQNELQLRGWFILRFTWEQLTTQPDRVIEQLRAAVELQRSMPRQPRRDAA